MQLKYGIFVILARIRRDNQSRIAKEWRVYANMFCWMKIKCDSNRIYDECHFGCVRYSVISTSVSIEGSGRQKKRVHDNQCRSVWIAKCE